MASSAAARLFIAGDPPMEVCTRLAGWARVALGRRGGPLNGAPLRLLDPALMHLTLCFLGARPIAELDAITGALSECSQPVAGLSLGAPAWLPARRPRALAVEVHDERGELLALHGRVASALADACGLRPESRRYRPHVTVARMGERAAPRGRELAEPTPVIGFALVAVTLYRSHLSAAGASYEALASVEL